MNQDAPTPALAIPDFDPEKLAAANVFMWEKLVKSADPEEPAMIAVGLTEDDFTCVYLALDPPGEAVVARQDSEYPRFTDGVVFDLHPAEALELATRLRICAEAAARLRAEEAARFRDVVPDEVVEAVQEGRVDATTTGTPSDPSFFPEPHATGADII